MTNPVISVMINNCNYAKTISRAIDSVINQTISLQKYEILVVDDGSTDNSWEIIQGYGNKINAIRQENMGALASNNLNFRRAKGKYVIKLDADDWFKENLLEKLLDALEQKTSAAFAYCDIAHVKKTEEKCVSLSNFHVFKTIACGILFRKKEILRVNGSGGMYNERFFFPEYDLLFKLLKNHRGIYVKGTKYYYFRHAVSMTANSKTVKKGINQIELEYGVKVPKEIESLIYC